MHCAACEVSDITMQSAWRHRTFIAALFAAVVLMCAGRPEAVASTGFTFFAIGDPQVNIPKWGTAGTEKTIDAMNALPGQPFPLGGVVDAPRGVLIAGDLVDDTTNPANWSLYKTLFDPRGKAKLRFPAFEGAGNHDFDMQRGYAQWSYVQRDVIARNTQRAAKVSTDASGYHYSWDWDDVHFVCLNVFPGDEWREVYNRPMMWNDPKGALAFLRRDLHERVGTSGRPVVVYWHYGLRGWGLDEWWLPRDLDALKDVLAPYNIALILHGHEHRYERYTWAGYDVVMAPSPQFDPDRAKGEQDGRPKGFVVARMTRDTFEMANWTPTGWQDAWRKTLR